MRKYLLNGSVIGAITGAFALAKQSKEAKKDWIFALTWVGWAISAAIAVGTVAQHSKQLKDEHEA